MIYWQFIWYIDICFGILTFISVKLELANLIKKNTKHQKFFFIFFFIWNNFFYFEAIFIAFFSTFFLHFFVHFFFHFFPRLWLFIWSFNWVFMMFWSKPNLTGRTSREDKWQNFLHDSRKRIKNLRKSLSDNVLDLAISSYSFFVKTFIHGRRHCAQGVKNVDVIHCGDHEAERSNNNAINQFFIQYFVCLRSCIGCASGRIMYVKIDFEDHYDDNSLGIAIRQNANNCARSCANALLKILQSFDY